MEIIPVRTLAHAGHVHVDTSESTAWLPFVVAAIGAVFLAIVLTAILRRGRRIKVHH